MQNDQLTEDLLRNESNDRKFHSFGYAKIFSRRASNFSKNLNWLSKFGFVLPAFMGIYVMTYGFDDNLSTLLRIAGPLSGIQFMLSLWAALSKWEDGYSYAIEAASHYSELNSQFKNLAILSSTSLGRLKSEYQSLDKEFTDRGTQDAKYNIKDWELRYGMRSALREYQVKCAGCQTIPLNVKSTDCDVCGHFSIKNQILNS